jgi:hypothetical protein
MARSLAAAAMLLDEGRGDGERNDDCNDDSRPDIAEKIGNYGETEQ